MKHLVKMALYFLNVLLSISGWFVLFYLASVSMQSSSNMVQVWFNYFGEMNIEYYGIIIIIFIIILSFSYLSINEILNKRKEINAHL